MYSKFKETYIVYVENGWMSVDSQNIFTDRDTIQFLTENVGYTITHLQKQDNFFV